MEKMISQTAFQFKGEGWYVTDYGRKGKDSVSEKVEKELASPEPAAKSDDSTKAKKSPAKKTEKS